MLQQATSSTNQEADLFPPESGRVAALSGGQVAFEAYGEGPPLVLVHGAFSDHRTNWTYVKSLLAPHFRVYAVARRGRGATNATMDRALDDEFDDVAAVVRQIGEPVYLLGHSYGAHVALGAAEVVPGFVRKLIVYEPVWPQLLNAEAMAKLERLAEANDWDGFAMAAFGDLMQVPQSDLEELKASADWQPILDDAPASYADLCAVSRYKFDIDAFRNLNLPVLLQTGSESIAELWATDALSKVLPEATISVLEGQAHEGMTTNPQQYVADVRRFLER